MDINANRSQIQRHGEAMKTEIVEFIRDVNEKESFYTILRTKGKESHDALIKNIMLNQVEEKRGRV